MNGKTFADSMVTYLLSYGFLLPRVQEIMAVCPPSYIVPAFEWLRTMPRPVAALLISGAKRENKQDFVCWSSNVSGDAIREAFRLVGYPIPTQIKKLRPFLRGAYLMLGED